MEELTYNQATLADYDDFYKIKCDPENVKWSGFASAPDYERMKEWYCKQLESEKRTIYIAYWNGVACGFFYLDKLEEQDAEEIGYGVLTCYSGKGIGTALVDTGAKLCKASELTAWVSEKNRASERCFEKNGFLKQNKIELRELVGFQQPEQKQFFFLWSKTMSDSIEKFNKNADNKCLSSVMGGGKIAPSIYAAFYNHAA